MSELDSELFARKIAALLSNNLSEQQAINLTDLKGNKNTTLAIFLAKLIASHVVETLNSTDSAPIEREYLTPKGASQLTSIPIRSLENWRRRETGPRSVHIGQLVRYPKKDLRIWMETDHAVGD